MIETYENILQIAVLAGCILVTVIRSVERKSSLWTILTLFYGSWMLGDIYWLACLAFYGMTPQISVVSDLSWYASYIFLYMLLRRASPPDLTSGTKGLPLAGSIFALGMGLFFMHWGEILSNLIYAELFSLLLYAAITRLQERRAVCLSVGILVFCFLEYGLWLSSCFWKSDTAANPYYWFDLLLTACLPFFLFATHKAVKE